jgi:diaminobutyrate-2-oxoglutarate transaminase
MPQHWSRRCVVNIFDRLESDVRSYCRHFPALFARARGPYLYDADGRQYIDFFSGAGSLNYGHNPPEMVRALVDYVEADGIASSLDMWTTAKARFLETFDAVVLKPRRLDYKVQFTGPTGANAVEAALKLARKVTRRANVIAFSRSYHGLSAGALSITANSSFRHESFVNRLNVSFVPYDGYLGPDVDTMAYLRQVLNDRSSGVDLPAAIIVETVQSEGGVNVASVTWLQQLEEVCRAFDILLIVDDIQVGCGRTGPFFSFERAGIAPDIVLLSKSISGMGLPMSLLLMKPAVDQWKAGEHTGTFRGNNLAFVTATEALRYWEGAALQSAVARKGELLEEGLRRIAHEVADAEMRVEGIGLIYGLELPSPTLAAHVSHTAFQHGLVIERCGPNDRVMKFLPPLVIDEPVLQEGLEIIRQSVATAFAALEA